MVRRIGRDYYLPNGDLIPFNPSRPIRHVVATESAKDSKTSNIVETENKPTRILTRKKNFEVQQPVTSSLNQIDWNPPQLGSESFKKYFSNGVTTREASKRKSVRIEDSSMDIDREDGILSIPTPDSEKRITEPKKKEKEEENKSVSQLIKELENSKISTTFSQLTLLSPEYAEGVIKNLVGKLPPNRRSGLTYISNIQANEARSSPTMLIKEEEISTDPCYYSCALGFVDAIIEGASVEFLVDSGSMVNVISQDLAEDLGLQMVEVNFQMTGVGGERCDLIGVVENCPVAIGKFSGRAHPFVSPKVKQNIFGRPFLFDYHCMLAYHKEGEKLSFGAEDGRTVTIPLAKVGHGRGWDKRTSLKANLLEKNKSFL